MGLFMLGARNLRRAIASRHWPTVSATVVKSWTSVDVTPPSRSMRRSRNSVSSIMYNTYGARVVYRYEVDGRRHYSNTRTFGQLACAAFFLFGLAALIFGVPALTKF